MYSYAKYYFELRTLAENEDQIFPTEPLDRDSAIKLEVGACLGGLLDAACISTHKVFSFQARSLAQEEKILESLKPTSRAKSMMVGKAKAPAPMILN
jgi:hypothetical protein